jgi:anti-anti-sigma regulatory factor
MMKLYVENVGDTAVIECQGRVVRDDAVFELRDAVQQQAASKVVLDLSEVKAIGGGGLGMLAYLERWSRENDVQLKLYSPSKPVLEGLAHNRSLVNFNLASFDEMMGMLAHSHDGPYGLAA